jgi:cysteinyl-tRNA synthetase
MSLHIYNTLTRRKEEFKPIRKGEVGMYVCGPTVYGDSHVGHAKSYVSFDIIYRYLRYLGYSVLYIQNITDVGHLTDDSDEGEDKVEAEARKQKLQPMAVVERYTRSYFEDMDRLNIKRPDISPRATGHIIEQIEIIKSLIGKGYAYDTGGSVYFNVEKFKDYGKLSGRSLDEMISGIRVESKSEKRHPADFALWKKAEPGHIMKWPSPWGVGYPGWHIECSAMSMKYLGEYFDIHGGGIENQFPHHECEIAQSEAATGEPFVKYWIHNNMVTVNGQKMGKSLGNFITLKQAFERVHPLVIRFFILQSHYRSPLDFSNEALGAAKKGYDRLINTVMGLRQRIDLVPSGESVPIELSVYKKKMLDAMNDDFNSPQTIAYLFDLSREVNQYLTGDTHYSAESWKEVDSLYREIGNTVLGVIPDSPEITSSVDGTIDSDLIQLLIDVRNEARKQKQFDLSDIIRDRLREIGVILEDTREGTNWKRAR